MKTGAVLFLSFGGPNRREDVMPFLENVTRGRNIPRARLEKVALQYDEIGGASPINAITAAQVRAAEAELRRLGVTWPVFVGQRNWDPYIDATLREMTAKGIRRATAFIMAAHQSEASIERYTEAVDAARAAIGPEAPAIDYVGPWFDHPLFVAAIVARVTEAIGAQPSGWWDVPWYFTAHSIPCPMAKDSTYVQELERTAAAVAKQFGKEDWRLAYTSRSGRPEDPWLEPDVSVVLRDEGARGTKRVLLIPIGFIADHVEVLYDLDVLAKTTARECGIELHRSKTVGDHPLFARMMADVIKSAIESPPGGARDWHHSTSATGETLDAAGSQAALCYCQPANPNPPCRRAPQSARPRHHGG